MKVFLSWSGETSRAVAETLREWLPNVLQAVEPWMSAEDIDKGARWSSDIAGELNRSKVGIICVTPENQEAPWLHFEAGALSKTIEKSLVCPYLIGLRPSEIRGPLVQFQATVADKRDTRKLVGAVNSALAADALPERQLEKTFAIWWPELENALGTIESGTVVKATRRPDREILEEILSLVRTQARAETFELIAEPGGQSVIVAPRHSMERVKIRGPFLTRPTRFYGGGKALEQFRVGLSGAESIDPPNIEDDKDEGDSNE